MTTETAPEPHTAAGWRPDPANPAQLRYWNGAQWSEHTAPMAAAAPVHGIPTYWPAPPRTSGLAVASMVLGILWIYWIGSLLALIFGYSALSQIKNSGGTVGGRGMAIAGVVLGWVGAGILAVILLSAAAYMG